MSSITPEDRANTQSVRAKLRKASGLHPNVLNKIEYGQIEKMLERLDKVLAPTSKAETETKGKGKVKAADKVAEAA